MGDVVESRMGSKGLDVEDIASELLDDLRGVRRDNRGLELAALCGLRLYGVEHSLANRVPGAEYAANQIVFDRRMSGRRRETEVAGALAHWLLWKWAGWDEWTTEEVERLGRALLMPREIFRSDLERTAILSELVELYPYASESAVSLRAKDFGVDLPPTEAK